MAYINNQLFAIIGDEPVPIDRSYPYVIVSDKLIIAKDGNIIVNFSPTNKYYESNSYSIIIHNYTDELINLLSYREFIVCVFRNYILVLDGKTTKYNIKKVDNIISIDDTKIVYISNSNVYIHENGISKKLNIRFSHIWADVDGLYFYNHKVYKYTTPYNEIVNTFSTIINDHLIVFIKDHHVVVCPNKKYFFLAYFPTYVESNDDYAIVDEKTMYLISHITGIPLEVQDLHNQSSKNARNI